MPAAPPRDRKHLFPRLGPLVLVFVASCAASDEKLDAVIDAPPESARVESLLDTRWTLRELADGPLPDDESDATLEIDAEGGLAGSTGVNRFGGALDRDALAVGHFDTGPLRATRRAGPPPAMELERRYLRALDEADGWRLEEGALVLTLGGTPLARFTAAPDS